MQQHELRQANGAKHKRKRVGRGNASGHGTYSTRGMKGQKARSGGGVPPHFEGGQLSFVRRMAYKRGFRNPFRVDYEEVNVSQLERFGAGATVTVDSLRALRIVQSTRPVKVLGDGELTVALTVEADSFSKSARAKIEAAGGTLRWIGGEPEPEEPAGAAAAEEAAPKKRTRAKAEAAAEAAPEAEGASEAREQEESSDGASS
jgi:large subunit ribosomal protein L15